MDFTPGCSDVMQASSRPVCQVPSRCIKPIQQLPTWPMKVYLVNETVRGISSQLLRSCFIGLHKHEVIKPNYRYQGHLKNGLADIFANFVKN